MSDLLDLLKTIQDSIRAAPGPSPRERRTFTPSDAQATIEGLEDAIRDLSGKLRRQREETHAALVSMREAQAHLHCERAKVSDLDRELRAVQSLAARLATERDDLRRAHEAAVGEALCALDRERNALSWIPVLRQSLGCPGPASFGGLDSDLRRVRAILDEAGTDPRLSIVERVRAALRRG